MKKLLPSLLFIFFIFCPFSSFAQTMDITGDTYLICRQSAFETAFYQLAITKKGHDAGCFERIGNNWEQITRVYECESLSSCRERRSLFIRLKKASFEAEQREEINAAVRANKTGWQIIE